MPEQNFARQEKMIVDFWQKQFVQNSFVGVGGVQIRYAKRELPAEKGALVLVSGRTEYLVKYAELFYDLQDLGYSFYIMDHRGQGASGRLLDDPQKGYVEDFINYSLDLQKFIDTVVKRIYHEKLFILSHSMGGAVSAIYGRNQQLSGQILCSPMLQINTHPIPTSLANFLATSIVKIGGKHWYVFGGGAYDYAKKFEGNDLSHSRERFEFNKRLISKSPVNALGSPTFGWLKQSFAADSMIVASVDLAYPVLLIRSGDDTVVELAAQDSFCAKLPDCTLAEIDGARHELLMEKDLYRDKALSLIRKFVISKNVPTL